jgi:hypothetical protein
MVAPLALHVWPNVSRLGAQLWACIEAREHRICRVVQATSEVVFSSYAHTNPCSCTRRSPDRACHRFGTSGPSVHDRLHPPRIRCAPRESLRRNRSRRRRAHAGPPVGAFVGRLPSIQRVLLHHRRRGATSTAVARRRRATAADPWDGRISREDNLRALLKARAPAFEQRDLSPILNRMREIKSPAEIASSTGRRRTAARRSSKLSRPRLLPVRHHAAVAGQREVHFRAA